MKIEEIYRELNEIFRDVFDDDNIVVNSATTAKDIEDWDSLEQINLIVAIERKFGIKFRIDEVNRLNTVGEMVEIIEDRLEK